MLSAVEFRCDWSTLLLDCWKNEEDEVSMLLGKDQALKRCIEFKSSVNGWEPYPSLYRM
jgi:hypothetical protein